MGKNKATFRCYFAERKSALARGGHVLITLKEGEGIATLPDGRIFYLWSLSALADVFDRLGLAPLDVSRQVSKIRPDDVWLGYVLLKLP